MVSFRISNKSLIKYKLDKIIFSKEYSQSNLLREVAFRINEVATDEKKIGVGFLYSVNLLTEIYKYVFSDFREKRYPNIFKEEFDYTLKSMGAENIVPFLNDFILTFPPEDIFYNKIKPEEYIWNKSKGMYKYEVELQEALILFLQNSNFALNPLSELIGIDNLSNKDLFFQYANTAKLFFQSKPTVKNNLDLISFLLEPIKKYPDNLQNQLQFINENWKDIIGDKFEREFLTSADLLREDVITSDSGTPPPTFVPVYKSEVSGAPIGKAGFDLLSESSSSYSEEENFTPDTNWMPKVVMIAKNTYVWLAQLSEKYGENINSLDKVPDAELEELQAEGINSLWLIGVWERSEASKLIKHIRGNIDAVASAYSLYDYEIATDLGGYSAYLNLNERAKRFGIRLAADMVPNHTGIYSKWIVEHPDYFIQSSAPPFPSYKFSGKNLSPDPNFTIKIEDGYWENSDAAVVFERIDNHTGERRYIYHGNDGTNMPWNDTAQLDIIKAEVREAVIQKILDVARKFSVIRFDAAMTLTKKHFARLWYPEPGKGGDIPSRSDFALTQEEFDRLFPKEFWREVVDRINAEMPETLLLAEAFWLMEGYFVRTLGMHRVYNSAFMNMFMREENAKYRELIKNTLEFEPEILKRYVNFMSNPDEETAIKQFGSGDKYFGVLITMITMPGLPMFAHGQIEGFHEKYGMEYKRAYYNETPNYELIERHKREIFPLLKKRFIFSEVKNFWLFPFTDKDRNINENVFAYTNLAGSDRALVLYNNKYDSTSGTINISDGKLVEGEIKRKSLIEALQLVNGSKKFVAFTELISGNQYLFKISDFEKGFQIHLNGFEYRVFSNFELLDETTELDEIYSRIGKQSFSSLKEEIVKTHLQPIHEATLSLFEEKIFADIVGFLSYEGLDKKENLERDISFITNRYNYLLHRIAEYLNIHTNISKLSNDFTDLFHGLTELRKDAMSSQFVFNKSVRENLLIFFEHNYRENLSYIILLNIRTALEEFVASSDNNIDIYEELFFEEVCSSVLSKLGKSHDELQEIKLLIKTLSKFSSVLNKYIQENHKVKLSERITSTQQLLLNILEDDLVRQFIHVNEHNGVKYYLKENFEELVSWFFTLALIKLYTLLFKGELTAADVEDSVLHLAKIVNYVKLVSEDSTYRYEKLKEMLKV